MFTVHQKYVKINYSEYMRRVFGFGDPRRETKNRRILSLPSTKNKNKIQRLHDVVPCIRVRGRCFKCFKCLLSTKNTRRHSEYTHRVFGDARRRSHQKQKKITAKTEECFYCPPKNRRWYSEYRRRVVGFGDVVLNVYCPPKTFVFSCGDRSSKCFKCLLSIKN